MNSGYIHYVVWGGLGIYMCAMILWVKLILKSITLSLLCRFLYYFYFYLANISGCWLTQPLATGYRTLGYIQLSSNYISIQDVGGKGMAGHTHT